MERDNGSRRVMDGVNAAHDGMAPATRKKFKKPEQKMLDTEEIAEGVKSGSRLHLGKAITLLESSNPSDKKDGQALLNRLLPFTGKSLRIGITGVPGAGKSRSARFRSPWKGELRSKRPACATFSSRSRRSRASRARSSRSPQRVRAGSICSKEQTSRSRVALSTRWRRIRSVTIVQCPSGAEVSRSVVAHTMSSPPSASTFVAPFVTMTSAPSVPVI